jgi:hypothetical protein
LERLTACSADADMAASSMRPDDHGIILALSAQKSNEFPVLNLFVLAINAPPQTKPNLKWQGCVASLDSNP